jgi:hypothetical protein
MANLAAGPFASMLDRARDAIAGKGDVFWTVGRGMPRGVTSLGSSLPHLCPAA